MALTDFNAVSIRDGIHGADPAHRSVRGVHFQPRGRPWGRFHSGSCACEWERCGDFGVMEPQRVARVLRRLPGADSWGVERALVTFAGSFHLAGWGAQRIALRGRQRVYYHAGMMITFTRRVTQRLEQFLNELCGLHGIATRMKPHEPTAPAKRESPFRQPVRSIKSVSPRGNARAAVSQSS
jgi:hypothetical protein